jgi:hypothetical protein
MVVQRNMGFIEMHKVCGFLGDVLGIGKICGFVMDFVWIGKTCGRLKHCVRTWDDGRTAVIVDFDPETGRVGLHTRVPGSYRPWYFEWSDESFFAKLRRFLRL